MSSLSRKPMALFLFAALAAPVPGVVSAQQQELPAGDVLTTVTAPIPADLKEMTAGPDIQGFISARRGDRVHVTAADGTRTAIGISEATKIKSSSGLFGGGGNLTPAALLNGLPVTVKTVQWGGGLVAKQIKFKKGDVKTAAMIHNGTDQRFGEQQAATEALRGRMADIDKYNVKATTNVNFDTGRWALSDQAKADLCSTASQANGTENALLLVVGYTDSVGSEEYNQALSERRASRVVNYLQQVCGWKPYRMLTPTGMSEAAPVASNDTWEGKAQNRRVSVNVLVSKSVDGL